MEEYEIVDVSEAGIDISVPATEPVFDHTQGSLAANLAHRDEEEDECLDSSD